MLCLPDRKIDSVGWLMIVSLDLKGSRASRRAEGLKGLSWRLRVTSLFKGYLPEVCVPSARRRACLILKWRAGYYSGLV